MPKVHRYKKRERMSSIAKLETATTPETTPTAQAQETFRFLASLDHEKTLQPAIRKLIMDYVSEFKSEDPVSLLLVAPFGVSNQQQNEMRDAIAEAGSSSANCADIEVAHTNDNSSRPFTAAVFGDPEAFANGLPQVDGSRQSLRQAYYASMKLRNASKGSNDQ